MAKHHLESGSVVFLVGLGLGFALSALCMPRNGEEVRRTIREKIKQVRHNLQDTANDASNTIDNAQDSAAKALEQASDQVTEKTKQTISKAENRPSM